MPRDAAASQADPNLADLTRVTPLMEAIRCRAAAAVDTLLSRGADAFLRGGPAGETAFEALCSADPARAERLAQELAAGASAPEACAQAAGAGPPGGAAWSRRRCVEAMLRAVEAHCPARVREVLSLWQRERWPPDDLLGWTDHDGNGWLHLGVLAPPPEQCWAPLAAVVGELVAAGAAADRPNSRGETPFLLAVQEALAVRTGREGLLRALLEAGAPGAAAAGGVLEAIDKFFGEQRDYSYTVKVFGWARVIEFFDSAGGAARPDLLALADLAGQPDDSNVGFLLGPRQATVRGERRGVTLLAGAFSERAGACPFYPEQCSARRRASAPVERARFSVDCAEALRKPDLDRRETSALRANAARKQDFTQGKVVLDYGCASGPLAATGELEGTSGFLSLVDLRRRQGHWAENMKRSPRRLWSALAPTDHFAPSNADLVDNAAREGTADNAASDAMATPGKNLTSMFGVIIMMQPGANGISLIGSEIRSVRQGSIGARAGVRVGDYIVAANGAPFKEGSLGPLESGTVPYTLTVSITCPAGIVTFGSFACGSLALAFLTVGNNGFGFVDHVANALYVFGLIRCLKSVLASPLLSIRLPDMAIARWRSDLTGIWLMATLVVLPPYFFRMAYHYVYMSTGVHDVTFWTFISSMLAWMMTKLVILEIAVVTTFMLGVAEHFILQLQNALSCKPADFPDHVHARAAELVNTTGPQLAPLGVPLLCLVGKMMFTCIDIYRAVADSTCRKTFHIQAGAEVDTYLRAVQRGAALLAEILLIAIGPLRLSAALASLNDGLGEVRSKAPELHAQVSAVEAMLERANGGSGWGIQICTGVVMNKEFLQTVCVRALLLSTAAAAFLDSWLGYENGERQHEAHFSKIEHTLANITAYIHNH
ncbi:unnamed protein product [Prorocentrum cordatum]|uniref:PDZ domain-containing protein n=1 Tax=Prorocentrum cordatum TaxID=2364126 RepID=A0ABN9UK36_9DINO|nr:unnamed protein product [Polarella glacialis]